MSNFNCEICGKAIVEGEDGYYITECEHYPKEGKKERSTSSYINNILKNPKLSE